MIYYIAQYTHFFTCSLDYLFFCGSLKITWLINQTKCTSDFKIFLLVALYLIKCFGTQALLTKFRLCLRNLKLCEKCNILLGLLVHFLLSTGFLIYYFFRFIALVFTNTFFFLFVFFSAFIKNKYLAFLLILPATVCIMRQPRYKNDCLIFNSVNRPINSTNKANVFNKFLTSLANFSVNVNVAVDISMNSNTIVCGEIPSGKDLYHIETSQLIYSTDQSEVLYMVRVFEKSDFQTIYHVTDFCNILRQIVKLKVIQTFKTLLKSESVNRSVLINSVYLWLNFSILLSHVFLKHRRDWRLKYMFMYIVFLCSFFNSPFKHNIVYNDVKLCHQIDVFIPE